MRIGLAAVIAVTLLLSLTLFLYRESILSAIGDFLIVTDELQPADIIHVIAGADHRTDYAIQLYKQGYARQIFFTGGWCSQHQVVHAEHGKERAVEEGVPPDVIATDITPITSTYAEALRLQQFIDSSQVPIHSLIIVSDPPHMRRARWAYQKVFGSQLIIEMAPVPAGATPYQRRWWTDPESRLMVRDEYVKTVFYYARYQFSQGPLRDWLARFDRF
jgi:uncharacterized SAM-binding protein YcdF (DUF218 family)